MFLVHYFILDLTVVAAAVSVAVDDLVGVGLLHATDMRTEVPDRTPVVPMMGPLDPHPP